RAHGVRATITMPDNANTGKVTAMRGLGAEVVFHGPDFDVAREWITAVAQERGGCYVGPTDAPLIHGVGTYALEILEELPDVDMVFVPVGGGSGASAVSIVAKSINPRIQVVAAQSAQAPAMQLSWKSGQMVNAEMKTFAEGVATRVPFENTQIVMRRFLDDFVLVQDERIEQAMLLLLEHTHNLAEGAGAVALAAALQERERLGGKSVVLVLSGGNVGLAKLHEILRKSRAGTARP
ncbi:MAG: pyridoxal-phosphate dependent enzyme, partial [Proteobacteria bacterium]|nr:pyridoxal-phosphate dependent enzyme [Pseudomonadota bacterium]